MFQVEWIQDALDDLMNLWMQSDSEACRALTAATEEIDRLLRSDPFRCSESREDEERVMFVEPLAAQIEVDLSPRRVWVLHVWQPR